MLYRQKLPTIEERNYCFRLVQWLADGGHGGEPDCGDVPKAKAKEVRLRVGQLVGRTLLRYKPWKNDPAWQRRLKR